MVFLILSATDINECETSGNVCDINAECNNTAGSYGCVCKTGYSGNGASCHSIIRSLHKSILYTIHTSSVCFCFVFFADVNECMFGTVLCDPNSDCVDTVGSYDCTCRAGYTGDGKSLCTGRKNFVFTGNIIPLHSIGV